MSTQTTFHLKNPGFSLQKQEFPASYTLQFTPNDAPGRADVVALEFSPADFEALLNQGRALMPSPQLTLSSPQENAAWREAAWPLFRLNDQAWQLLIREIATDPLVYTLWFLKDLALARKVVGNLSARAGACLTEELVQRFAGKNPDEAPAREAQTAQACLREILDVLARLQAEGQIAQES